MGTLWAPIWVPYRAPISRFHFVNYCPFGAGMWHPPAHIFRSVPLRDILFLRAPSGPQWVPIGHPCGYPYGAPTFQKLNYLHFYLHTATQEKHIWGGGRGRGTHEDSRRLTPRAHMFWPLLSRWLIGSLRAVHIILFIFEGAHRAPLWAPRSVGPYGVGRAPTPLMHAPCGGMHMGAPQGHPL